MAAAFIVYVGWFSLIAGPFHVFCSLIRIACVKDIRSEYAKRILKYQGMVILFFLAIYSVEKLGLFSSNNDIQMISSTLFLLGLAWAIGFYYLYTIYNRKKFETIFH